MNAILQQLYFVKGFRNYIFTATFSKPDQIQLQQLFCRLALSACPDVNTRPFCDVWEGWNNRPINVREQQDAGEFLNMFLDRLPDDCQTLFRGSLVHTITGMTETYSSSNEELFFTLPIDIGTFPDVDASLVALLHPEQFIGADGLAIEGCARIDASKSTRI
jgi:hypothetical protein